MEPSTAQQQHRHQLSGCTQLDALQKHCKHRNISGCSACSLSLLCNNRERAAEPWVETNHPSAAPLGQHSILTQLQAQEQPVCATHNPAVLLPPALNLCSSTRHKVGTLKVLLLPDGDAPHVSNPRGR